MQNNIKANLKPMSLEEALEFATYVVIDGNWYRVVSWDMDSECLYYMDEDSEEEYSSYYDDLKNMDIKVHCLAEIEVI